MAPCYQTDFLLHPKSSREKKITISQVVVMFVKINQAGNHNEKPLKRISKFRSIDKDESLNTLKRGYKNKSIPKANVLVNHYRPAGPAHLPTWQ